jgi:hypothetical protein
MLSSTDISPVSALGAPRTFDAVPVFVPRPAPEGRRVVVRLDSPCRISLLDPSVNRPRPRRQLAQFVSPRRAHRQMMVQG